MKPLEGITVIDFSTMLAAPMTGRILAEWGANVIKVESISGDVWRTMYGTATCPCTEVANPCFDAENINKRFVSLNTRTKEGMEILHRLLSKADVFISNYRVRALEDMGLAYEQLKDKYPHLIHASVLGYGAEGPEKDRAAYDYTTFYARTGIMADLAPAGGPPVMSVAGLGDHIVAISLAGGICAALAKKAKTGVGEKVDVALCQAGFFILQTGLLNAYYGKKYPRDRYDPSQATSNTYQCSDGEWFYLGTADYRKFPELCRVLGIPEVAEDPRYGIRENFFKPENKKSLTIIFEKLFLTKPLEYWHTLLTDAGMPHEPCYHMSHAKDDPMVKANHFCDEFEYSDGTRAIFSNGPVHFSSVDYKNLPHKVSGAIGRDNHEVLKEFGYSEEEITAFRAGGFIK